MYLKIAISAPITDLSRPYVRSPSLLSHQRPSCLSHHTSMSSHCLCHPSALPRFLRISMHHGPPTTCLSFKFSSPSVPMHQHPSSYHFHHYPHVSDHCCLSILLNVRSLLLPPFSIHSCCHPSALPRFLCISTCHYLPTAILVVCPQLLSSFGSPSLPMHQRLSLPPFRHTSSMPSHHHRSDV